MTDKWSMRIDHLFSELKAVSERVDRALDVAASASALLDRAVVRVYKNEDVMEGVKFSLDTLRRDLRTCVACNAIFRPYKRGGDANPMSYEEESALCMRCFNEKYRRVDPPKPLFQVLNHE
jgi:hypothetical protein